MDLGSDSHIKSISFKNEIASEIKQIITRMGDQINDAYWDKDKRIQNTSNSYSETRSIIFRWVDQSGSVSEIDYTTLGLKDKVYNAIDSILKDYSIPKGLEVGTRVSLLGLTLTKIKPGDCISKHLLSGDYTLIHKIFFIIQGSKDCQLTVADHTLNLEDGICFDLNTTMEYAITNDSSSDLIYMVFDYSLAD